MSAKVFVMKIRIFFFNAIVSLKMLKSATAFLKIYAQ